MKNRIFESVDQLCTANEILSKKSRPSATYQRVLTNRPDGCCYPYPGIRAYRSAGSQRSLEQGLTLRYPGVQHHGPGAVQAFGRGFGYPQGDRRPTPGPPGALHVAAIQLSRLRVQSWVRDAKGMVVIYIVAPRLRIRVSAC